MSARRIRIISRLSFFVCGLLSWLTAVPYALLRGADLPAQSEWVIFVAALVLLGALSVMLALSRRKWIGRLCRRDCENTWLFSGPLKMLAGFAVVSYAFAVFAHLAPHSWNLNPQIMLALCPMYLLRMMVDPSSKVIFFLLAPMNAGVFGALGLTLGYVWLFVRAGAAPVTGPTEQL